MTEASDQTIADGLATPTAEGASTSRPVIVAVAVVLALVIVVLRWETGPSAEAVEGAKPLTAANVMTMPDLVGQTAGAAEEKLEALADGLHGPDRLDDVEIADYSPLNSRYASDDWLTVATSPKQGEEVKEGTKVRIYALQASEIEWFAKHETMPAISPGATEDVVAETFEGVAELLLYRYEKGSSDGFEASEADMRSEGEPGVAFDPRVEPKAERAARKGLREASEYATIARSTLPMADAKTRLGQLIVLIVEDEPQEPAGGIGSGGGDADHYYDGDDDFNVPGWLCPTRFC